MSDNLTTGRAMAFERLLAEDAIMLPQYRKTGGRGIFLAKALNRPFEFERTDTAYSKTLDFLPSNWKVAAVESIGGKTVVWNQLVEPRPQGTTTNNGIDIVSDGNGNIALTGTSAINNWYTSISTKIAIRAGHKYLLAGCPSGGSSTTYRVRYDGLGSDTGSGAILTASADDERHLFIEILPNNYTVTNLIFQPQLFDLTLMFGSGNEPSTVAEFKAMFPTIDPAYNAGQLISAGVTGAVSRGKNILNLSTATVAITDNNSGASYNSTAQTFSIPQSPSGGFAQFAISNVNLDFYAGDTVTFTLNGSSLANVFVICLYDSVSSSYFVNGEYLSGTATRISKSVSITASAKVTQILLRVPNGFQISNCSFKFQIERGSTATTYTPYRAPVTLPIPAAVQALPGYGWSAGSVYNYIDWQRKVYVQRVAAVDLGSKNWSLVTTTGQERFFTSGIADEITSVSSVNTKGNILCPLYVTATFNNLVGHVQDKVISEGMNKNIQIYDSEKMSLTGTQFKTAMSGVMLYYELATPIETDISAYLTDDNLLQVEPSGTLTFPSQLGDGYRIPVPTKVKYQRRGIEDDLSA